MSDLVIGSGGREDAIAWRLKSDGRAVVCAPGNAGMVNAYLGLALNDFAAVVSLAKKCGGTAYIGSEVPLVNGLADQFIAEGLPVVGPAAKAARTEGSKAWFKRLLHKYDIPTMPFQIYDYGKLPLAFTVGGFIEKHGGVRNIVVKASGLCAGKGVLLPETEQEVYEHCKRIRDTDPSAVDEIVIEERALNGEAAVGEVSLIGLTDGQTTRFFPTAQDHKREFEKNKGRNTGGMGAYTTTLSANIAASTSAISTRINDALHAEGILYRGFFYDGFLLTDGGPKVSERNCRFGDPEAEAILPSLGPGFADACEATAQGRLASVSMPKKEREAVAIVLASRSYPDRSDVDALMRGIDEAKNRGALVFFSSAKRGPQGLTTGRGGRVLVVVGTGKTVAEARKAAYEAAEEILKRTPELRCRMDIAA